MPAQCVFSAGSDLSDADPAVDWEFVTTPQTGCADRVIHYARGKTLGGSSGMINHISQVFQKPLIFISARNFMVYQRPTKDSLQMWADEVGDNSYTWDNFLPYFKKSVQFTPPNTLLRAPNATAQYNPSAFEVSGGPLQVSYPNYAQPFSR